MEPAQLKLMSFVIMTSLGAVAVVFLTAVVSILIVSLLRSVFAFIVRMIAFVMEVIVAFTAAVTSGTTVTMSIVAAACAAAVTFPASSIEGRIGVSVAVSSASIVVSSIAVLSLATIKVEADIAVAIVTAAAMSVSFASAWAVGVLSLIEKETHHVGLKITSVLDTVRRNNHRILRLLLKLHTGIKQRDIDQALLYSVKVSYMECAEALLSAGANVNARDSYDNTPLALACETGSIPLTKMLLNAGADVTLQTGNRCTALHKAANWGSVECIQLLLAHAASPDSQDGFWRTPLMLAIMHAPHADQIVRLFIEARCDVNLCDTDRKTALHYAAERGLQPDLLLAAGAELEAVDVANNTVLHAAATFGHGSVIHRLLEAGCNASTLNNQLRTPLHLAAMKGDVTCLESLHLAYGEAHLLVDSSGNLPAWYATYYGHYDASVFFVRSNCSLQYHPDRQSCRPYLNVSSPLQAALDKRRMSVVIVLLLGGCDHRPLTDWLTGLVQNAWTEEHARELDWIARYVQNPLDLGQLCRLVVRRTLGARVLSDIEELPLPKQIKDYICMNELLSSNINDLISHVRHESNETMDSC